MRPEIRPHLGMVWQLVSKWELQEPVSHRVPLPAAIYRAMVSLSILWSWFHVAGILVLAFEGICRPGETLRASRCDLLLPCDLPN